MRKTDGIKKYWVSKYYWTILLAVFPFPIGMQLFTLLFDESVPLLAHLALHAFCIFLYILLIILALQFGKFSFDEEGLTVYCGPKTYQYRWDEFVDAGLAFAYVQRGGYTAWVYFSKHYLTESEKKNLINRTRFKRDQVAYFQYDKKNSFDLVLEKLPENLRHELEEEEKYFFFYRDL